MTSSAGVSDTVLNSVVNNILTAINQSGCGTTNQKITSSQSVGLTCNPPDDWKDTVIMGVACQTACKGYDPNMIATCPNACDYCLPCCAEQVSQQLMMTISDDCGITADVLVNVQKLVNTDLTNAYVNSRLTADEKNDLNDAIAQVIQAITLDGISEVTQEISTLQSVQVKDGAVKYINQKIAANIMYQTLQSQDMIAAITNLNNVLNQIAGGGNGSNGNGSNGNGNGNGNGSNGSDSGSPFSCSNPLTCRNGSMPPGDMYNLFNNLLTNGLLQSMRDNQCMQEIQLSQELNVDCSDPKVQKLNICAKKSCACLQALCTNDPANCPLPMTILSCEDKTVSATCTALSDSVGKIDADVYCNACGAFDVDFNIFATISTSCISQTDVQLTMMGEAKSVVADWYQKNMNVLFPSAPTSDISNYLGMVNTALSHVDQSFVQAVLQAVVTQQNININSSSGKLIQQAVSLNTVYDITMTMILKNDQITSNIPPGTGSNTPVPPPPPPKSSKTTWYVLLFIVFLITMVIIGYKYAQSTSKPSPTLTLSTV